MSPKLGKVLDALRVTTGFAPQRNGKGFKARCPAHDDRRPSLTVAEGSDGRVLLKCFAGCKPDAIVQALGLRLGDIMPPRSNGQSRTFATFIEAIDWLRDKLGPYDGRWDYRGTDGEVVGIVLRWDTPQGKEIRPVSRHGDGWAIAAMPSPRPLYRLDALLRRRNERVFVVEGEKAADEAAKLGLLATTSAGGSKAARKADWSPLAGREVVILPDNDEPGRAYARDVAARLCRLAPPARVRIVELPDLPAGGDLVDFAEQHDCRDDVELREWINRLADEAPKVDGDALPAPGLSSAVTVRLMDVRPEPLQWLWPDRIPLGKLTLIAGDPGLGKSALTLDIAARVSSGMPWPDRPFALAETGGVVLLSAEDDLADTIRPRLDAAKADVSRITAIKAVRVPDPECGERERPLNLGDDLPALDGAIRRTPKCRLVVIDPVSAYMPGGRFDSHRNTDVRGVLAPLAELATKLKVAIVAVTHLRKSEGPAMYRALGSLAYVAAARSVWAVARDHENRARRLFVPVKNNLADKPDGLAFTITSDTAGGGPVVAWEPEPVKLEADDVLGRGGSGRGRPATRRAECEEWLRQALEAGPRPAKDLIDEGVNAEGFAERTIRRARKTIGVIAERTGDGWCWRLPGEGGQKS